MNVFHSLKERLFLSLFIFLLALIIVITIVFYQYSSGERKKDSEKYFMEKVDNISLQLDTLITKMDTVSSQLLASEILQKMFVEANSKEYQEKNYFEYNIEKRKMAQDILWAFNSPKRQVENINIFSKSSYVGLRYSPATRKIMEQFPLSKWDVEEDENYRVLGPHMDEWDTLDNKEVISLIRPFIATYHNFIDVGVIEVQEKYSTIEQICDLANAAEELDLLLIDEKDDVVYQSKNYTKEEIYNLSGRCNANMQNSLFKAQQDEIDLMVAYSKIENAEWRIILIQPETSYQKPIKDIMIMIITFSVALTTLTFMFLLFIINNVTKPILQLASDIDQVSHIDQIPVLHTTSIKELRVLQRNFMQLMERINESANELFIAHETELNLRIMGLQSQIDPHFLFNSLAAISATANAEKSSKVPIMCYQLSELFRYSSSSDANQATMKSELEYIRTYLDFMKWRYEENFHFKIIEQGDLSKVHLARLTLQPLVENSFTHGFKGTFPPYLLTITCEVQENAWSFCVADNGIGFSEEMIARLKREILKIDEILAVKKGYDQLKAQDMAILNIYIRLKIQYKESLSFAFVHDSNQKGALVKIIVAKWFCPE